jgi:hypothetical protein
VIAVEPPSIAWALTLLSLRRSSGQERSFSVLSVFEKSEYAELGNRVTMVVGDNEKGEDGPNGFFACCFTAETKPEHIGMLLRFSMQIRPVCATRVAT